MEKNIIICIGRFKNIKPLYAAIVCEECKRPKAIIRLKTIARIKNSMGQIVDDKVRTDEHIKEGDGVLITYELEQEKKSFSGEVKKINSSEFLEIECEGNISTT